MNAIGLIFFILSLLSIGAFSYFEKEISSHRSRSTYFGHINANRDIINKLESRKYKKIQSLSQEKKEPLTNNKEKAYTPPIINPHCSKLNLNSLLGGKKEENYFLYTLAIKLLKKFYGGSLFTKGKEETHFLDAWLLAIEKKELCSLEKVDFSDPFLQSTYYKMLKGKKGSYPSLLDYFKIESTPSKISLYPAHPSLLTALFSEKAKDEIIEEIRKANGALTQENIERLCLNAHFIFDPKILDYLDFSKTKGDGEKDYFVGIDSDRDIAIRHKLYQSQ